MSVQPRKPSALEAKRNILLNVFNKKYFLGDGIYSSHSYAILAARSIYDKEGNIIHLIRLRTPWLNERWTGDWGSNKEGCWTEGLKEKLNFYPEKNGHSEFWMPIRDFMHYFDIINVVKAVPGNVFNSVRLKFPKQRYPRAAIRFHCPKKGKYTISIDQQDLRTFGIRGLKHCPVKLSLCKLEDGKFQLLSHTNSTSSRTTSIRKLIDEGEYYVLVELENIQKTAQQAENGENRDVGIVNMNIYGPASCGIKVIECEEVHIIYDFLLYEGWKSYAQKRIGNHVHDFNLTFNDGSSGTVAIYLLIVPNMIIYAFKNDNDYGVDINTEILGMVNKEIVGPEGKVSFNQHFKIDAGHHDVFILRNTEIQNATEGQNLSFKMKSIVGSKYQGVQPRGKNVVKVYEFLYYDVPESNLSIIDKIPELKMAKLYDQNGQEINDDDANKEIKVKTKSVIQAAKFDQDHKHIDADDDEIINAIKNAGVPGVSADGGPKYKLKTPEGQIAIKDKNEDPER